jgi:hypothetical protein
LWYFYKMVNCRILDDVYWEKIYSELNIILPDLEYPVKKNIDNPIPYLSNIKKWDIIILDNFFFREWREQPLWDDFLWQYLKLWYECKIICVSNYWEKNIQRFPQWYKTYLKWDIVGFVPNKRWWEIADLIVEKIL